MRGLPFHEGGTLGEAELGARRKAQPRGPAHACKEHGATGDEEGVVSRGKKEGGVRLSLGHGSGKIDRHREEGDLTISGDAGRQSVQFSHP